MKIQRKKESRKIQKEQNEVVGENVKHFGVENWKQIVYDTGSMVAKYSYIDKNTYR